MGQILLNWDYQLFNLINSGFNSAWADQFFVFITDLHKTKYFFATVIPFLLFLFVKKYKRLGITYFIFLLLSLSVGDFVGGKIKHAVERQRPEQNSEIPVILRSKAGHYSFYSNHASNMFTLASYTSYFIPALKIPLFAIATAVGYSRVYNGVHYPSDVLTGALIGLFWGMLFSRLIINFTTRLEARKKSL